MKTAFLILGIGVGCGMYAFVNSRYNDQKWAASKYFWVFSVLLLLIGIILLLVR